MTETHIQESRDLCANPNSMNSVTWVNEPVVDSSSQVKNYDGKFRGSLGKMLVPVPSQRFPRLFDLPSSF